MSIPIGTDVLCGNTEETRKVILIFKSHGLLYWPTQQDRFPTEEDYLMEFERYRYVIVRSGEEIAGSSIRQTRTHLTFQEFCKKYDSKKLKLHNMVKDFM